MVKILALGVATRVCRAKALDLGASKSRAVLSVCGKELDLLPAKILTRVRVARVAWVAKSVFACGARS